MKNFDVLNVFDNFIQYEAFEETYEGDYAGVPIDDDNSFVRFMKKREINKVKKLLEKHYAILVKYYDEIVVFSTISRMKKLAA